MVERGGQTPYQPGMTVLSGVAFMGGFNYRAGRATVLQPGDVVNVFERRF
jgi:polysaccharide export outer membrane protein